MRSPIRIYLAFLLAATVAGCGQSAPVGSPDAAGKATTGSGRATTSRGAPVSDQVGFIEGLRGRGVAVEIEGTAEQPFLTTAGKRLRLSGGGLAAPAAIESYQYDDVAAAGREGGTIDSDGNPKTSRVTWTAPPHFYHSGRLIVLHVGGEPAVTRLLTGLLGPQFAGG